MGWPSSAIGQIGLGVIANAVSLILLTGVAIAAFDWRWRRARRSFFGITKAAQGAVRIKLSNLHINPRTTSSVMETPSGFQGSAVAVSELHHALYLASRIETRPLNNVLSALASQMGVENSSAPIVCRVSASPSYQELEGESGRGSSMAALDRIAMDALADAGTYIVVGGPLHNAITRHLLDRPDWDRQFSFERRDFPDGTHTRVIKAHRYHRDGAGRDFVRTQESQQGMTLCTDYFILQKVCNWGPSGATIFLCAGTANSATVAAVRQLADWRALRVEFGDKPFSILGRVLTSIRDLDGESLPRLWAVTREYPAKSP